MLGSISSTPIEARRALFRPTGEDEEERFVVKLDRRQFGVSRVGRDDRCVEGAVTQAREKPIGQVLHQIEGRVRQRLGESRQGDRQQVGRDGRDDAEAQFAGEGIARRVSGGGHARRGGERRARLRHDRRRSVADASAAAFAVEQAKAEFGLELEDLTAQRRLTDVARRRRAAKMAVVGDRDHIFEVSEVHSSKDWRRQSLVKRQSIGPIALTGLSRPDEMAVTRKRHRRRLWSSSINPDLRQRDAEHHWRKA